MTEAAKLIDNNADEKWGVWDVLGILTVALPLVTLGGVMITGAKGGEALMSIAVAYVPGAVWVIDTLARKFVKLICKK